MDPNYFSFSSQPVNNILWWVKGRDIRLLSNSKQIKGSSSIVLLKKNIEFGPCTALIRDIWKPGTETPVAIVIHPLHSFVGIKAWFSQPDPLQHTAAIFERDLAAKTLHFVSVGWKPENQFRPKQLGYFFGKLPVGNIFVCNRTRRWILWTVLSCLLLPSIRIGQPNDWSIYFNISPLFFPCWHIVAAEQTRLLQFIKDLKRLKNSNPIQFS